MSNVRKGDDFEREVVRIWKEHGFNCSRTARSHGAYDIVATKFTTGNVYKVYQVILMQCKVKKRKRKVLKL